MDVPKVFEYMTMDEIAEFINIAADAFLDKPDRTPLEAPPKDMSWLKTEDTFPGFDESFARMIGPKPPVPPKELWEQPKPSEPKIDDLRIITRPGEHCGVWFWIEKYYAKEKWNKKKGDYDKVLGWYPVDKDLYGGPDCGHVYRWSRDNFHATKRALKMINKHEARVSKYEANQARIKSGTKTYTLNTDR